MMKKCVVRNITTVNKRPLKINMYADDITLVLKNFIDSRIVLSKIKFSECSGLFLNTNKTYAVCFYDDDNIYGKLIYKMALNL